MGCASSKDGARSSPKKPTPEVPAAAKQKVEEAKATEAKLEDSLLAAWEAYLVQNQGGDQGLDLTNSSADAILETEAKNIMAMLPTLEALYLADATLRSRCDKVSITVLLAIKMAISKRLMQSLGGKAVHMSWVVAVYGEQNRILTKQQHDNGEDFVRRKVRQMKWLQDGISSFTWDLLFVDDGCPNNSGELIKKLIIEENLKELYGVDVIFLQDGIDQNLSILHGMKSTKDSRKGGAVHYGLWYAGEHCKPKNPDALHIVGYTDADLSSSLAQTGLLLAPIVKVEGTILTLATRYEDGGLECSDKKAELLEVAVDNPAGIAFRHFIRKNVLPPLAHIFDTQCGFKCMRGDKLAEILPKVTDKGASFDMELLVVTGLLFPGKQSLVRCPVVWVASAAESNFWQSAASEYETHYKMNKAIIALSQKQSALFSEQQLSHSQPYVEFFGGLTPEQFERMCEAIKAKLQKNFDRFEMTFDLVDLRTWAGDQ